MRDERTNWLLLLELNWAADKCNNHPRNKHRKDAGVHIYEFIRRANIFDSDLRTLWFIFVCESSQSLYQVHCWLWGIVGIVIGLTNRYKRTRLQIIDTLSLETRINVEWIEQFQKKWKWLKGKSLLWVGKLVVNRNINTCYCIFNALQTPLAEHYTGKNWSTSCKFQLWFCTCQLIVHQQLIKDVLINGRRRPEEEEEEN